MIKGTITAHVDDNIKIVSDKKSDRLKTFVDETTITASFSETGLTLDPASKLMFSGFPSEGTEGAVLDQFTVYAARADNSLDPTYSGTVTLAVESGAGAIGGTVAKATVGGVATFDDITLDATGSHTLNANASGLTEAISDPINILAGTTYATISGLMTVRAYNSTTKLLVNSNNPVYLHYDVELDTLADDRVIVAHPQWHELNNNGCAFWRRTSDGQVMLRRYSTYNGAASDNATGLFIPSGTRITGYVRFVETGTSTSFGTILQAQIIIDGIGTSSNYTNLYVGGISTFYKDITLCMPDRTYQPSNVTLADIGFEFNGKIYEYRINTQADGAGTDLYNWDWSYGSGQTVPAIVGGYPLIAQGGTLQWT